MAHSEDQRSGKTNRSDKGILLDVGTNEVEFLEFGVGEQRFAVNVAKVHQVVPWMGLMCRSLPHSSPGTIGTVLYRDEFLTAYDLRTLLGISGPEAPESRKLLLVAHFNCKTYGFRVDCVYGIERMSWTQFSPIDGGGSGTSPVDSSVIGTLKLEDRLVLAVDFEAIMAKLDPGQSVESHGALVTTTKELDRSKVHILYCEDSPTVRRIASTVLRTAGYTNVFIAETGKEGLEYLKTEQGKSIDIILSDIEMPEMDGLTLCKLVKSQSGTDKIPVVFFSSLISEQMKTKCESVSADAWFTKPEIDKVVPCLDELYLKTRNNPS
jgi:two-component system chemotaxis response regulator CheV